MADEKLFQKYIANLRGKWPLVLLCLLGVALLLFGGWQQSGGGGESTQTDGRAETEAYRRMLEEELTALCSRVDGVGSLSLMITLSGSEEAVYAADRDASGREDYVVQGGEGLLLSRRYPAVAGVAVVCRGGSDPTVVRELTSLICAALDIGASRVHISAGG